MTMNNFSIKVSGHVIKIIHKPLPAMQALDDYPEEGIPVGCYSPMGNQHEIWLSQDLTGTGYFSVVLHEILECLNVKYGTDLTHQQVSTIAEALSQVLLDNKKRFKGLLK